MYCDSSKGFIINKDCELFSYNLNVTNFTFTKKKYNFEDIFNKLVEIFPKKVNNYDFLKEELKHCLLSIEGEHININGDELGWEIYYLSLKDDIITLEQIFEKEETFYININNFIIEETIIYLDV